MTVRHIEYTVRHWIYVLGGPTAVAKALGCHRQTVHAWIRKGDMPAWRWEQIERLEKEAG